MTAEEMILTHAADVMRAAASIAEKPINKALMLSVHTGLLRMLWLREKGRPDLRVVIGGEDSFEINDPGEEALFKIGSP